MKQKHLFFMLLCCLIPVVAIMALVALGLGGLATYGLFLLCPLMMIFMMREHKGTDHSEHDKDNLESNKKDLP